MKKITFLSAVMFLLSLCGCLLAEHTFEMVQIHNYTDSAIYVCMTCSEKLELEPKLTLFESAPAQMIDAKGNPKESISAPEYRVNAYSFGSLHGGINNQKLPCKGNWANLFFIKETTMRKYSWDEIVNKQMFVKKQRITKQELDSLDGVIKYKS